MVKLRLPAAFVVFIAAAFSFSCSNSSAPISVTLSSASPIDPGQSLVIAATVANDVSSRGGVAWSLNGPGSLSAQTGSSVTYVASPSISSAVQATVSATSIADASKTASVQITVNPEPSLNTSSLPNANAGGVYNETMLMSGGTAPFKWAITEGALPPGLNINSGTGAISGTATAGGTWYFLLQLTDATGVQIVEPLNIEVDSNVVAGNPKPLLNNPVVPDAATPGGPGFTLLLYGTGFRSNSSVFWNNTSLATTFLNQGQLAAMVPATLIGTAGTASIKVVNPIPGGGISNVIYFPVATPKADVSFLEAAGSPLAIPGGASSVAVGDFTGEGRPDLAVTQDGENLYSFLGNGDGTFNQAPGSPIQLQSPPWDNGIANLPDFVVVGDFDNSGKLGLAVANLDNLNVSILLGDGDGTFRPSSAFAYAAGQPMWLATGDFTGNGNLSLAVANIGRPLNVLLGNGDGAFNQSAFLASSNLSTALSPTVGDFNIDGKLDIAVTAGSSHSSQNQVTILLGNGDGTFSVGASPTYPNGAGSGVMAAADLNGDGRLDLIIADPVGNSLIILLGNGDGTFSMAAGSPIAVGNDPDAIGVADLNGDGKLDLVVANFSDNTLSVLLGNGDGTFTPSSSSPFPVAKGPASIAIGDFNNSGRLGLAVANLSGDSVSILVQQP